jgi:penicillin-binding protein 2
MPLRRIYILCAIFCALLSLILARAFWLQIVEGSHYTNTSSNRLVGVRYQRPRRGTISDRNGIVLAIDRPAFDLKFTPSHLPALKDIVSNKSFRNPEEREENLQRARAALEDAPILQHIAAALAISEEALKKKIMGCVKKLVGKRRGGKKIIIVDKFPWSSQFLVQGLEPRHAIALEAIPSFTTAFSIEANSQRAYPHNELASHIIGYMTRIKPEELNARNDSNHHEMLIGRSGIEKFYHTDLAGIPGQKIVEKIIDKETNEVSWNTIKEEPAIGGRNITLTIDLEMQSHLQEALGTQTGAAVLLDVHTGAILALASYPRFNPNLFIQALGSEKKQLAHLLTSPTHPLINRAIQKFPPGSVFKVVTGLAALESGTITPRSRVTCRGGYQIGNYTKHCWNRFGHGSLNLQGAIMNSCNPFFYDTSLKMGATTLQNEARKLGFGSRTGIDLPYEKRGLVPTDSWKRSHIGHGWVGGDTANLAIGQGFLQASPLQVARLMALIANGGSLVHPHLDSARATAAQKLSISADLLIPLRNGLHAVVNTRGGTAHRYRPHIAGEIAAKTSTAQSGGKRKPHAWFAGYYPFKKPQYAFAFIAEFGGSGGAVCGSMAQRFFEKQYPAPQP